MLDRFIDGCSVPFGFHALISGAKTPEEIRKMGAGAAGNHSSVWLH